MAERKLDIFNVLSQIDKKNIHFYSSLSSEEQKGFYPIVVVRWLSGTFNKLEVSLINQFVNPFVFSLYKHPDLLYKLMTVCTSGKVQKHVWIKKLSNKPSKPYTVKIIQEYFCYNSKDAEQLIKILTPEEIVSMAEEMGWQDDDLNKAKKELNIKATKTKAKKPLIKNTDILEL